MKVKIHKTKCIYILNLSWKNIWKVETARGGTEGGRELLGQKAAKQTFMSFMIALKRQAESPSLESPIFETVFNNLNTYPDLGLL